MLDIQWCKCRTEDNQILNKVVEKYEDKPVLYMYMSNILFQIVYNSNTCKIKWIEGMQLSLQEYGVIYVWTNEMYI